MVSETSRKQHSSITMHISCTEGMRSITHLIPAGCSCLPSTHPDLLPGRGCVVRAALHEDEMCGREVQCAVRGLVAEAIHQAHLLHLRTRVWENVVKTPDAADGRGCSLTRVTRFWRAEEVVVHSQSSFKAPRYSPFQVFIFIANGTASYNQLTKKLRRAET